jgi:hypothetical protein
LSLETGELPQDSTAAAAAAPPAAAAAEASNIVLSPPGQACELNAPAALPPLVANSVLPLKRSGRMPIPVPVALPDDAGMAWLESAVADVLHPQGEEERQQQQEGGALSRDRSSVWERLGGAFSSAQNEAGSPKAAAAARSPSPALAGRLRPELQLPLQRNRSTELPSPALASRLQPVPMPYDSRPSPKQQQQQLTSVPQLPPATIDLLDLAIVDAFVEHAGRRKQQRVCAEMGWLPEEHPAVREELQQRDAEMPLEVCSASSVAKPPSYPVRLALVQLSFVPGLLDAAAC